MKGTAALFLTALLLIPTTSLAAKSAKAFGAENPVAVLLLVGILFLVYFLRSNREEKSELKQITNGYEFEGYVARLLLSNGFSSAKVTKQSGDQGVDVLATCNGVTYAIQCKLYSRPVGNKAVQEAYSGKDFYNCQVGVVATNNHFTNSARELAAKHKILLWDKDKILAMEERARKARTISEIDTKATTTQTKKPQTTAELTEEIVKHGLADRLLEAIDLVYTADAFSLSTIQRELKIGYAGAGCISDYLAGVGIINADKAPYRILVHKEDAVKIVQNALPDVTQKRAGRMRNSPTIIPPSDIGIEIDSLANWIKCVSPLMGTAMSEYDSRKLAYCCDDSEFYIYAASFPGSNIIEYSFAIGPTGGFNPVCFLAAFAPGADCDSKIKAVSRIASMAAESASESLSVNLSKTFLSNGYYFEPFLNREKSQMILIWINKTSEIKRKDEIVSRVPLKAYPTNDAILDCSSKMISSKWEEIDDKTLPAIQAIYDANSCSMPSLQRKLQIGHARAEKILNFLSNLGIVASGTGRVRRILVGKEDAINIVLNNLPNMEREKEEYDNLKGELARGEITQETYSQWENWLLNK